MRRNPESATIDAVTHDGRGIAAIDGKKVFVAGALPGEQVRILRRKIRRGYDEADLLEVEAPSPERIMPRCDAFGICGGCALQHVAPADQRKMKEKSLRDSLERIGNVSPARWLAPVFDPDHEGAWRYRRRARLAVREVAAKGRVLVGFRERRAPIVTDMHRCEVLSAPLDGLIDPLAELIATLSIRRRLPQIEVAVADNAVELVFRVLDPPTVDDKAKLAAFGQRHCLSISLQPGSVESAVPLEPDAPRVPLYYELPEFDMRIHFEPTDFIQVNGRVNRLMVLAAIEALELRETDRVLDLFCGIGNFSLPLARHSGHVMGLEGEAGQVSRAAANAVRNGVGNCEFRCADLAAINGREPWIGQSWDKLLLDPPRCGAEEIVRQMAKIGPARLVYISCHPATLARDAAILTRTEGYRLDAAGIIDMFPHTAHVEAIAVFSRPGRGPRAQG
ncbi:MAG TPA: 23S rRNA (uracil(1939)-C(5))-methyltransferase RlmD [Woeseiaceae bacterium]|nr:23S rRNA (uracil(1939)-C(5))-methyltransferase RlmD [Woeseiaceae bacterium]